MKFVVGARLEMVSQKIDKVSLNIEDFRVTTNYDPDRGNTTYIRGQVLGRVRASKNRVYATFYSTLGRKFF